MEPYSFHGDAFSEYYCTKLMWNDPALKPLLAEEEGAKLYRSASSAIRYAQRKLEGKPSYKSTYSLLLKPLSELLKWNLGEHERVATEVKEEEGGYPLFRADESASFSRVVCANPSDSLDAAPTGQHRRFSSYLSATRVMNEVGITYGVLMNAYKLRLICMAGSMPSYIEFELDAIAEGTDAGLDCWKMMYALLRQDAMAATPTLIDRLREIGKEHQERVSSSLGQQVKEALKRLMQGVIDHPENKDKIPTPISDHYLIKIHHESLRFLYRLLFILYAEDLGLLPLDVSTYREGYSLKKLIRMAKGKDRDSLEMADPNGHFFQMSLLALFELMRKGANLGPEGKIKPYGGGLFDSSATATLDSLAWGNATVDNVIEALTLVPAPRGQVGNVRLSYRELNVEQLGSIYEGLLELAPAYAPKNMWRVKLDDRELIIDDEARAQIRERRGEVIASGLILDEEEPDDSDENEDDDDFELTGEDGEEDPEEEQEEEEKLRGPKKPLKIIGEVAAGSVYLKGGMGRKSSGSYYTNRALVDFLVRETIDPLAEGKSPEEILSLKVLDPAMGSAHFLVGACRRMGEHLLASYREKVNETSKQPGADGFSLDDLLVLSDIPDELRDAWNDADETRSLGVCRLLVAGNCIHGVDRNPLAVDLAKVSLWLITCASRLPLTFLDHKLRAGDSLLGIPADEVVKPWIKPHGRTRAIKPVELLISPSGGPGQMEFGTPHPEALCRTLARTFQTLKRLKHIIEQDPANFVLHKATHQAVVESLKPWWEVHQLRVGLAFQDQSESVTPSVLNSWLDEVLNFGFIRDEARAAGESFRVNGESLGVFCWEMAFPEVFYDEVGQKKPDAGFSVVIGNPPWDKIKPNERELFVTFDPLVWDVQGQERKRLINRIMADNPLAATAWREHEFNMKNTSAVLLNGGNYFHQIAEVEGKKTGGDPDTFKFFVERAYQLLKKEGLAGIIVPLGLQGSLGCTALRRLLLDKCGLRVICKLDNERFIFPGVFHGQKFDLIVFQKGRKSDIVEAGFFSWEPAEVLDNFRNNIRYIQLEATVFRELAPEQYTFVELHNQREVDMVRRIYATFPRLGEKLEGTWNVSFTREFDMSNDSFLYREAARLNEMGATLHAPGPSLTEEAAGAPLVVEDGGQYWTTPDKRWYEERSDKYAAAERHVDSKGRVHLPGSLPESKVRYKLEGYIPVAENDQPGALPVKSSEKYVPLYEGRMVHQFDHAAKAYIRGSGRRAKWQELDFNEKQIVPHYFMAESDFKGICPDSMKYRTGFCDVTGQANERSSLAALLSQDCPAGNSVPTATTIPDNIEYQFIFTSFMNSFVVDFLFRKRVSNHLNFFVVDQTSMPRKSLFDTNVKEIISTATILSCVTSEMSKLWNEMSRYNPGIFNATWTQDKARIETNERARLRAELDARITILYEVSAQEYALILSTFPLLDQDQPYLPGDCFIRLTNKGEKRKNRSFITRDLALLTYFRLKGEAPPDDIVEFFAEAGVDISRNTGPILNLEERVRIATEELGAVAYLPTIRKKPTEEALAKSKALEAKYINV